MTLRNGGGVWRLKLRWAEMRVGVTLLTGKGGEKKKVGVGVTVSLFT